MKTKKLIYLSDYEILTYSKDNIITDYHDAILRGKSFRPVKFGVYDPDIFGSIFSNSCNCGRIRVPSDFPCPVCGSQLLDIATASKRFGRIELPVKYLSTLRENQYFRYVRGLFDSIQYNFHTKQFHPSLNRKVFDICQFDYDEENKSLIITDNITDNLKCSYEGLESIVNKYFGAGEYENLKKFTNYYVLVSPIPVRTPAVSFEGNRKVLVNDALTVTYKNILYVVQEYYKKTVGTLKTQFAIAMLNASLRRMVSNLLSNASEVLNTSKANITRNIQANRLQNSGRCTIIPAPDLKIDEVGIPRHLMYETCRDEFIQYMCDQWNIDEDEATVLWKDNATDQKLQDLFTQYIEGTGNGDEKYVIINRAPTLYELGMMAMKVKLTNEYVMRLPMAVCVPFNADFDGDAMTFYAVPKVMNDQIVQNMSPRNIFYFKKSHKPLFLPTHDMMKGLILGSRMTLVPEENQLSFESVDEAKQYWIKNRRKFKFQHQCKIANKTTTLGRAILSEYFGKDIDAYLSDIKADGLNAKNIVVLYSMLEDFEDRPDRILKIQEFALQVSTLSGSTALTVDEMYFGFDNKHLDEIKSVISNEMLSHNEKEVKVRELYSDYAKEMTNKLITTRPEVKTALEDTARAKVDQWADMAFVTLNIDTTGDFHVGTSTIANGMNPTDYTHLAIENRATQDIKTAAVPESGYTTRQFVFLATNYSFSAGDDTTNKGVLIPECDALGRTKVDGSIVEKSSSKDLVRVRSIIGSTLKNQFAVTKDMLPRMFKYADGARVGMSMMSSLTEQLTQAGLALKHGGKLFMLDKQARLEAPEDCTLQITDKFIILTGNSSKKYIYPKPNQFTVSFNENNTYKKGELVGVIHHLSTPAYVLNSIEKLTRAQAARADKAFMKNRVIESDCYCIADGVIHYAINPATNLMSVSIGDQWYEYNPDAMYQFPEGASVKKYDRICSGVLDMNIMTQKVTDYEQLFYYYRNQFNELMSIAPELIEFAYSILVKSIRGNIVVRSVIQSIKNSKSLYTSTAFGYAGQLYKQVPVTGMQWFDDQMSRVLLPLISDEHFI